MNLQSILISNGTGVFILLMLFYTSRTRILRRNLEDRLYKILIFGVLLGCCMEAASYILDGRMFPGARFLNYVANSYLFFANLFMPFVVMVYIDYGLYGDIKRIWKHYKPQIFIGLVMYAINIVNYFIPISYYITEQNVYERRPVSYVYYFVILYYCLTGIVVSKRYEKENGARAFFNMKAFLLPILIGAALQFMFYGLSLAWLSSAVGLVCLYMMQQNEMAYIDSLVDTFNRQYLSHILSVWIDKGKSFCGAMIDIDRFKAINDHYGHSEGDRALKTVTNILKRSRLENELVFRFAGDEFIVLKLSDSEDGLRPYLDRVNQVLEEHNNSREALYTLELSYGISWFKSGDVDTFMKEMDSRMYEMKSRHHKIK